jgi:hypothetical protein
MIYKIILKNNYKRKLSYMKRKYRIFVNKMKKKMNNYLIIKTILFKNYNNNSKRKYYNNNKNLMKNNNNYYNNKNKIKQMIRKLQIDYYYKFRN